MGFLTVAIAIIATSILVLWGLRGTAAEVNDSWKHSEFNIPERRTAQIMSLVTEQQSVCNPRAVLQLIQHYATTIVRPVRLFVASNV